MICALCHVFASHRCHFVPINSSDAMTTTPNTEVEAFVVLYARCNDIAELLSDEANMVGSTVGLIEFV